MPLDKKVKKIMSYIFELSPEELYEDSSPETIVTWDSLHHMNLILAFEKEFEIKFKTFEVEEMLNYNKILSTIKQHLENK